MLNSNDKVLRSVITDITGPSIHDPGDLEEVIETAFELVDSPDFNQAIDTHGYVVLACAFAELADKLERYDFDEEKRIAIARLGRDRKYEKADELFKILSTPEE